ncbi:hypothetical protein [Corynebacterium sp. HS2168-gen11]|uniref:hypothetical protein n=1 Tax=Corynebacterium sp. HS2168-gen11 TaxID=2974027 RepID=UPI00216AD263|nr:hypothetical protein [Corynebacterium sp. HS2168-gen11]MCS4535574.1 hypothetical protein [Corynebacterium sp. HS2168-gen11]
MAVGEQPSQTVQHRVLSTRITQWLTIAQRVPQTLTHYDWIALISIAMVAPFLRLLILWWYTPADSSLAEQLFVWDAHHYRDIALYGYFSKDGHSPPDFEIASTRLAFFPGLPALLRILYTITGVDIGVIGALLSNIGTFALLLGTMKLAARLGAHLWGRIASVIVIATAPMSIVFQMVYTEAIFLAFMVWAMLALLDQRWWHAAVWIALAGCFRLTAIDLVASFFVIVALLHRRQAQAWIAAILSAVPVLSYLAWASWHTRDIGGYFGMQARGWNSSFDGGVHTLKWVYEHAQPWEEFGYFIATASIVSSAVILCFSWRAMPWEVWLPVASIALNVLLSDGIMHSRPRLLLPAVLLLLPAIIKAEEVCSRRVFVGGLLGWAWSGLVISAYMLAIFEWAI